MAVRRNTLEWALRVKDQASSNIQRVNKSVNVLGQGLKRLAVAGAAAFAFREVVRLADTYRLLANRLRIVTFGTANLNKIQEEESVGRSIRI